MSSALVTAVLAAKQAALAAFWAAQSLPGSAPTLADVNSFMAAEFDTTADYLDPPGTPHEYAGSSAPAGWFLCNGQAISRTAYPKLWSALGTTWGSGDGSTTFNLPDLVGATPAGAGVSVGYAQNETIALGTKYGDQVQGHYHDRHPSEAAASRSFSYTSGSVFANPGAGGQMITSVSYRTSTGTLVTDTTNGSPRIGNVTRGKRVGVNFIVRAV